MPYVLFMAFFHLTQNAIPSSEWLQGWGLYHERTVDAVTNGRGIVAALATLAAQISCLIVLGSFVYLHAHRVLSWRLLALGSACLVMSFIAASILGYRSLFTGWGFRGNLNLAIGVSWFVAIGIVGLPFLGHLRGTISRVNQ